MPAAPARHHKKKKKKRRGGDSSSSSSAGSVSTGTDEDHDEKYAVWVPKGGTKRKFSTRAIDRQHTILFKRRSDLIRFHHRNPGGLAAHFLQQVRAKLMLPLARNSDELRDTDPSGWASTQSDLKDTRDQKELLFLMRVLHDMAQGRLQAVADLLVMRARELRFAKSAGGSWEKAAVLSLIGNTSLAANAPVPDGGMAL